MPEPDAPAPQTHSGVESATEQGHLELMIALRKSIASRIDEGIAARDLAALSRRLIEIDREIRQLTADDTDPITAALEV